MVTIYDIDFTDFEAATDYYLLADVDEVGAPEDCTYNTDMWAYDNTQSEYYNRNFGNNAPGGGAVGNRHSHSKRSAVPTEISSLENVNYHLIWSDPIPAVDATDPGYFLVPGSITLTLQASTYFPGIDPWMNPGNIYVAWLNGSAYDWDENGAGSHVGNGGYGPWPSPAIDPDPTSVHVWEDGYYIPWSAFASIAKWQTWSMAGLSDSNDLTLVVPLPDSFFDTFEGSVIKFLFWNDTIENNSCNHANEEATTSTGRTDVFEYDDGVGLGISSLDWQISDTQLAVPTTTLTIPRLHIPHKFYGFEGAPIEERVRRG